MGGQVMPGCMGTAALARDPYDLSYCTCVKGVRRMEMLELRVDGLWAELRRIADLCRASGSHLRLHK